jgi:NADH:ubiquinone oxidoreductase subunit 4 (subunit M)
MPLFSAFFCFFTMANIALPLTSSFVGEFLLLIGIFRMSFISSFFACFGVILCGSYSLWLYNRIVYGNLKINNTLYFYDINLREFSMLFPLLILMLLMGIYPKFFINYIQFSSSALGLFTMF